MHGQHVLVLGLGASGLAMARWCARLGAQVSVADTREAPPQWAALQSELPSVRFLHAPLDAALLDLAPCASDATVRPEVSKGARAPTEPPPSLLLKSPGIAPHAWGSLRQAALQRGIAIGGELSLFAQALQDLASQRGYAPRLLAVTGTNGKTTVTSLTGQLVARAGKTVAVAGNIGPTLLDTLALALDRDALPEVWVMELSSFQLDADSLGAQVFEPTAAALLNLTQDHLDWHASMQNYAAAKARILGPRTLAVVNRDDALVMAVLQLPPAKVSARKAPFDTSGRTVPTEQHSGKPSSAAAKGVDAIASAPAAAPQLKAPALREHVSFGDNAPPRPGDYGVETVNGMAWLARALPLDPQARRRMAKASMRGKALPEEELFIQRLMPLEALRIRGRHNAMNALAALALAESAGCTLAGLLHGLREYRGEPHRVESVAVIGDVEWFDDSKGTNVGATVAALQGLGVERKLVLILGGEGKGQDFSPLIAPFKRYARAGVLIGRDAALIRALLKDCGLPLIDAASMEQAVALAAAQAQSGDAVLMSPACASFDMFDNYEHRAQLFRGAVLALAQSAGQVLEGAL